mmetsp:Transcript_21217/g.41206  ORF Transcript_21217/g.41206 Transcript_21217/m.41206 type:complete len:91 (-) Transcript_21217:194-466(-)
MSLRTAARSVMLRASTRCPRPAALRFSSACASSFVRSSALQSGPATKQEGGASEKGVVGASLQQEKPTRFYALDTATWETHHSRKIRSQA